MSAEDARALLGLPPQHELPQAALHLLGRGLSGDAEARRLSMLGDAVLYLAATELELESAQPPRDVHARRALVITNRHLAERGRAIGVERLLLRRAAAAAEVLGDGGDRTIGRLDDKRVADAVEALLGAAWTSLGGGFTLRWLHDRILRPQPGLGPQRPEIL